MDIKKLENELSKFIYELETEDRKVRVGLKEKSEQVQIFKKFVHLFNKENLKEISNLIKKSKNSKEKDILERIYFATAGSFIGAKLAKLQDEIITYFSQAQVTVSGEIIPYYEIGPRISKEWIFEKREIYEKAGFEIVEKINDKQLKFLEGEIAWIKTLGFKGYLDYFSKSKQVNYDKFYKVAEKITQQTANLWFNTISKVSQDVFGRPFKNINSCHTSYLRSLSMFDNFFPAQKVVLTFLSSVKDLDLADLLEKIKIDDRDRPRKNPRAVCYWPKPPDEIHLVIKPIGGEQDFESILHEGGHALHGAAIDPKLPYSLKTLAHSNALTEAYAFILEDLVFEPIWLSTYLNVSAHSAAKIRWQAYFVNLMLLRRYLGKFSYEYQLFSNKNLTNGPILYAKNLKETTGFIYRPTYWLSDMDSGFYSAEYLRAWIGAAQIKDYLWQRFGQRWFLNKKAGIFLRSLWSRGVTDEIEDVVKKLGYEPFDISYLIAGYREVLG